MFPLKQKMRDVIAKRVSDAMHAFGAEAVDVHPGLDHDGDEVLFIDIQYADGGQDFDPVVAMKVRSDLARWLLESGDERFPHFRHHFTEQQKVVGF
jgi:hypothetical protein